MWKIEKKWYSRFKKSVYSMCQIPKYLLTYYASSNLRGRWFSGCQWIIEFASKAKVRLCIFFKIVWYLKKNSLYIFIVVKFITMDSCRNLRIVKFLQVTDK